MRAIVLIDHGSREPRANAQLEEIAALLRERLPETPVVTAHMELAEPTIAAAVEACVRGGASEIVVAPYFLALGRHAAHDIPLLVEEAAARHPGLRVAIAAPLGVHPGLVDAVAARISEGGGPSRSG
jgi:sirohydrochlorin ferrochelatase